LRARNQALARLDAMIEDMCLNEAAPVMMEEPAAPGRRTGSVRLCRILHVLPDLERAGGQQVVARSIAHLDPDEFACTVCSVGAAEDMAPDFAALGVTVHRLVHDGFWSLPRNLPRLVRLIRNERIDIVHVHGTPRDKLYGQLAAWWTGRPVVRTIHGQPAPAAAARATGRRLSPRRMLRWLRRRREGLVGWALDRLALDRVVVVSDAVLCSWRRYLRRCGRRPEDVTVIYNGIPLERFINARPIEFNGEGPRPNGGRESACGPVLINVGRLSRMKGQDLLIPMMSRLVERWPNARLLLVGEGEYRTTLEAAIASAGLAETVRLLGRRDDVASLLAGSDLFIFSSRFEGFPLVVLEAMAAALPIVAVRLPGLDEAVRHGENGLLVEEPDPDALVAAVTDILSDPRRARHMGQAGRAIVAERFEIGQVTRQLEAVYRSVITGGAAAGGPAATRVQKAV